MVLSATASDYHQWHWSETLFYARHCFRECSHWINWDLCEI